MPRQGGAQSDIVGLDGSAATKHDQVYRLQAATGVTEAFANHALDPVAIDGSPRATFRNGQPEPRRASGFRGRGTTENREEGIARAARPGEHPLEVSSIQQSRRARQACVGRASAVYACARMIGVGPRLTDRQD